MSHKERRATIAKIKDLKKNYPRSEALKPLVARLINEDVPRSRLINPVDTEMSYRRTGYIALRHITA